MNTTTVVVLFTISSLTLIATGANLALMLVGAKMAKTEIAEVKKKTNRAVDNMTFALENLKV